MIDRLLTILQQADLMLTNDERTSWHQMGEILDGEDIADAIWLAAQMGAGDEVVIEEPTSQSQPENSLIAIETIEAEPIAPSQPFVPAYLPDSTQPRSETIAPPDRGLPIQVQAAPALQDARSLARSFRPLMRKVPSSKKRVLDEPATVDRIADQDIWVPVMKPALERWLDLELVIEASPFAFIWQSTLEEFQQILERQGAFRNVRTWRIEGVEISQVHLVPKKQTDLSQPPRSPKELIDVSGRRLVLYVSDCRSQIWKQGKIHDWLRLWSKYGPTAIVQLLPERFWNESELDVGIGLQIGALIPGVPNHKLVVQDRSARLDLKAERSLTVPIVTLTAQAFKQWALMLAAVGNERAPARWFDLTWVNNPDRDRTASIVVPQSPEEQVELFFATASPVAQKLARLMAAAPVNLQVIHLIQRTLLPESNPVHVAEVYASGLLTLGKQTAGVSIQYDFTSDVRTLLVESTPEDETILVLDELSKEIASTLGLPEIRSFTALLSPKPEWNQATKDAILPFAQIATQVLHRLGGDYASLAEAVERNAERWTQPSDLDSAFPELEILEFTTVQLVELSTTFPPLQMQEVEVVTIIIEKIPEAEPEGLQPFEFEVATLERKTEPRQTGFLQNLFRRGEQQTSWVIQKQRRQAYQWVEKLGYELQLEMVAIPAGRFVMGSPEDKPERINWESPQHQVRVETFFMGRYPVTQAQWRFMAGLPQVNQELNPNPSFFKGEKHPVECVSWDDAVEFCARLSAHTGRKYRLPSEAEWEYACRASPISLAGKLQAGDAIGEDKSPPFNFGETITTALANYRGTDDKERNWSGYYGQGPKGDYREETTPIDYFGIANAFGLCDMHGNVWEWCLDHWHKSYAGAPTDGSAWLTEAETAGRVIRGGSWYDTPWFCRSAYRFYDSPDNRNNTVGFRVVCSAPRTL